MPRLCPYDSNTSHPYPFVHLLHLPLGPTLLGLLSAWDHGAQVKLHWAQRPAALVAPGLATFSDPTEFSPQEY
jgi:hypothetical protein